MLFSSSCIFITCMPFTYASYCLPSFPLLPLAKQAFALIQSTFFLISSASGKPTFHSLKGFSYNSLNHTTSGSGLINTRYVFRRAHRGDPDPLQRSRVLQLIPNPLPLPIQQPLHLRARTHLLLAILRQRTPTTAIALAKLHLQQHD
ncbi:uncharacterized protein K444DRAFT_331103 [Hyaloscypha bicolor E]|uniref:Uncharacterized protein n=1 Tax=Hyaloscypha bicolor E TaxID=1095630 RepID=A0A2J6TJS8_9HELO|nr:uncharacterized protein K444DRAFT_331103 [Hyaloscypha bicolor E]PMD63273.1 hypothetical protein K444DRAFT_331103 [Hyaloscypha bicolor E]